MGEIFRDKYARRYYFWSNEGNEPPHIHVRKGDAFAKYWLGPPLWLDHSVGFRRKHLRLIEEAIEAHRELILEKWNEQQHKLHQSKRP
jgi:hypothetical protein